MACLRQGPERPSLAAMRWFLASILAAAAIVGGAGEASACVYTAVEEVLGEEGLSAAERERRRVAREQQHDREQVRRRAVAAEAALATGTDAARVLADMLVPNVRPVFIEETSCGDRNEIDHGAGRESWRDWLAGTRYEGREGEFGRIVRDVDANLPGTACNAEFRDRFAGHLRRRLTAAQQREAYLFLAARWPAFDRSTPMARLTAFQGDSRRPPARWSADDRLHTQIVRWTRRDPAGRTLQRAMDDFWRESAPLFGDYARLCPAAEAEWQTTRAQLLADLNAEAARRAPPR
jgi:hypothetical protein